MGYFPAKSAVFQPTYKGRDTNGRRILAKSVSDGWAPETLHGVVRLMVATLLSLKEDFCPSFMLNREIITSSDAKSHGSTRLLERGFKDYPLPRDARKA